MLHFVLDLDDTLIATREIFIAAEQVFVDEVERLGFDRNDTIPLLQEAELNNIERYGFTPLRFPTSLGQTYEILCRLRGRQQPNSATRARLEDIGRQVFLTRPRVLPGAVEVLEMLTAQGDELFLWTKGDREVQTRNLKLCGLEQFFSKVYILDQKTDVQLRRIVAAHRLPLSSTWIVGDSIRSDINPALEVGAHAIWVAGPSWPYENVAPVKDTFLKLDSIAEMLVIYPSLYDG